MLYENLEVSGSLKVAGFINVPAYQKTSRPATPPTGSLYLQTTGSAGSLLMVYTGVSNIDSGWEMVAGQANPNTAFKYRQIINYAYVAGGYKDASPWKTVHKTTVATDQTLNMGDLLDYTANYTKGGGSKTIMYVFSCSTSNSFTGPGTIDSVYTSAYNMMTDTTYTHEAKFDITTARADVGVCFKETEFAYLIGGYVSTVDKFNYTSETCLTGQGLSSLNDGGEGISTMSDEWYGYASYSGASTKLAFATDTFQAGLSIWAAHGQQKGISSKVGKGYAGNEGSYNGGYNLRRWQFSTDTNIGNVPKPDQNTGEENFTMGQDWQYMLGNYNGAQNNNNWKFYYATDTGTAGVAGLSPYAHAGQSSGANAWRQ